MVYIIIFFLCNRSPPEKSDSFKNSDPKTCEDGLFDGLTIIFTKTVMELEEQIILK